MVKLFIYGGNAFDTKRTSKNRNFSPANLSIANILIIQLFQEIAERLIFDNRCLKACYSNVDPMKLQKNANPF